jgi:hypothetical protein
MKPQHTSAISASAFSRMNKREIRDLAPVTILMSRDKPVAVVIKYEEYLRWQAMMNNNRPIPC